MKISLLTILAIFVALYLYSLIGVPIPFTVNSIQTNKSDLFYVTGNGEATAVPDAARISLGVTKNAASVADAQNQVNTATNKIVEELKKLNVEEKNIKTTNYTVSPQFDFTPEVRNQTNGYTVTQNIDVKIKPIEQANKAVDIATTNGANLVGGITFVLDDETRKNLEEKAREDAIKNAKKKAQALAKAAGIRLGRVVDVQESNGYQPMRYDAMQKAVPLGAETQPTQLNPGENTVSVSITLSYQTY